MVAMAAVCVFAGVLNGFVVNFHQQDGKVTVSHNISVSGDIHPNSVHGFHIHEKGDLGDGCKNAGGHYNPAGVNHGYPDAAVHHKGDMGNLNAGAQGILTPETAIYDFFTIDEVIGKAIVFHADADDGGLGGQTDSLTTGHAGARVDCCKIATSAPGAAVSVLHHAQVWITTAMLAATIIAVKAIAS